MKHQPPPLHPPAVGLVMLALILSHGVVFTWGVLIGAWVW